MADKYTDDKLYKVVRKDGSHLNTKVNPDGTKSALQFTDDNNDLNGPVDLIEVDEEELIRTEYIQVPQNKRSLGELLVDEVFVPVIRDATTQLLEYGTAKAETWIEEKVVPVAKTKVKAGWENLKLFISTIKDSDKPIKAMVVTSSIPRCVEYYYAINKCLTLINTCWNWKKMRRNNRISSPFQCRIFSTTRSSAWKPG